MAIIPKSKFLNIVMICSSLIGMFPSEFLFQQNKFGQLCYSIYSKIALGYYATFLLSIYVPLFVIILSQDEIKFTELSEVLLNTLICTIAFVRQVLMKTSRFKKLLKYIINNEEYMDAIDDQKALEIDRKSAMVFNRNIKVFLIVMGLVLFGYTLKPLLVPVDKIFVGNGTILVKQLPALIWLPFNEQTYFKTAYLFQLVDIINATCFFAFGDLTLMAVLVYPIGQLKVLQHVLMHFESYQRKLIKKYDVFQNENLAAFVTIRECIRKHNIIINYVEQFNATMGTYMFLEYVQSSIQIAFVLVPPIWQHVSFVQLIVVMVLLIMINFRLFLYYYYANQIMELPCPDAPPEFREEQCLVYDNIPYEEGLYQWLPFYDDDEPCALTCKGKPEGANEDALLVVARLKDKVHDGTRCRPGSLDMCINGRCERVGCDLKIGSNKQVDECGVCGGDGSSCAKPLYHWTLTYASLCSATCGGGYKMSRPVCQNRVSGDEAEEELCNDSQRPDNTVVECNVHNCPPKWHLGEWEICSVSCGGGSRLRQVHCVEETNNTKIKVDESKCGGHKPWSQEACNQMDCPTWFTTKWSGCSVSCGEGVQTRVVECQDTRDQPSDFCDAKTKPETTQACSTGIACPFRVDTSEELMPGLYQTQPLEQPYPPPPMPERLVGEQIVPSESTFIPDEWGPCSVTCGEGIRRREVHCKIFLEFSRTIAKLPDKQCSGVKPIEVEKCYREPCMAEKIGMDVKDDPSNNIKVGSGSPAKSYSWKEQGFTHCSASCLGGVQELIVNCVRDDTLKVTSPFMCPIELKPEVIIRACNEHSCPPRWTYTEFSTCSQSCGIGIQTRDVNCIHELTQGGSNTVVVPNNRCPQPPPPDRQYCNVLDCPVRWKVSDWVKCSKACGGGEKTRKADCKQVMAQNHTVDRPATMCPSPRPSEKKPCNTKSCVIESDKPHISVTNSTFIQHDPKKNKVTVKVGGAATLFTGTTVKIKCPVKRYDRSKIQWKKDNNFLPQNKKFKSSKKGALRVQNLTLRDMGTYTCVAGKSTANIVISVRPKPGEFPTSEEIQKQYKSDLIAGMNAAKAEGKPIYADDQSHEQRPDGTKKNHYKLFTPTSPSSSLTLDGYVVDSQTTEESGNKRQDKVSNLPSSSVELLNTPNYGDSKSSASRVMPNFLSLISKIQNLWPFPIPKFEPQPSRGHRMVAFPFNSEQIPATDQALLATSSNEVNEVVLGKGTKENLSFEWKLTDWSKCSETCGGSGVQIRTARCIVRLHNTTQSADDNLCDDAGIPRPSTSRKCGFDECPQWTTSQWTPCEHSKCFALHKAMQRRIVKCQIGGNLTVDVNQCVFEEKPGQRQECENSKCVGKWKVGSWSQCNAKCGEQGEKYRTFYCVWYGTKKPAGEGCKNVTRPPTRKSCKGPPCNSSSVEACKDLSMFCSNVKSLNMCKIVRYKQQCCHTCENEDLTVV